MAGTLALPKVTNLHRVNAASAGRAKPAGPKAVGSFVPRLTRKAFEKYGFSAATLLTDWAQIVGPQLAAYTAPERLKWPRDVAVYGEVSDEAQGRPGATLLVRVDGARALDIEYRRRELIERINGYFGYRAVAELRIIQAPLAASSRLTIAPSRPRATTAPSRPVPTPDLAAVGNEALRAALARLHAGVTSVSRRTR